MGTFANKFDMKVEQKGHTTTLKNTKRSCEDFLQLVSEQHNAFKDQNLVLDLTHVPNVNLKEVKLFADLSKAHKKNKKSFVIVVENIDFNAVPAKMIVVPTHLEAHDIIEMEEIERDLGF